MHEELVKMNVKRVLERLSQGDCPIAAALPTETLEFVIQHQSSRIDALERELAEANHQLNKADLQINALTASHSALRARTLAVIEQTTQAMKPIAGYVYNDNFSLTVSASKPTYDEVVAIWWALRAARALEDELKGGVNGVSR